MFDSISKLGFQRNLLYAITFLFSDSCLMLKALLSMDGPLQHCSLSYLNSRAKCNPFQKIAHIIPKLYVSIEKKSEIA